MFDKPPTPGTVKAVFAHLDCLVNAIDIMKRSGHRDRMAVTAPLPRHEIEEMLYEGRPSPVRWFTMCGAIFGGSMGFALAAITSLNWPMIIPAGKPLVSIPAYIVITFEATILMGCLFTLVGMLVMCRLPGFDLQPELEDRSFSDDKFGMVLNGLDAATAEKVQSQLLELGAVDVSYTELDA